MEMKQRIVKPWLNGPASSRKLMQVELASLALGGQKTGKFSHKYTQVANKLISRQTYPVFHWLIIRWTSLNLRWLGLGGQTVKNLLGLACKFDLDQSERRSSQCQRKSNRLSKQVHPSFQLASTCVSVWRGLYLPSQVKGIYFTYGVINFYIKTVNVKIVGLFSSSARLRNIRLKI